MGRLTIEEIKERMKTINPNVEIFDDYFENSKVKMQCGCKRCGYKWSMNWANMPSGRDCPKCAGNIKYTFEDIKNKIKNMHDIEIIDDFYNGIHSRVNCSCNKCKHEWRPTWGSLRSGRGCPLCAMELKHGIGAYIPKNAERFKTDWINKPGIVYIIECENGNEHFYKIGITKNSIKKRFENNVVMPYKYKIIDYIETTLYDAIYIESKLHQEFSEYKYKPLIKFDGYRECYSSQPSFK